MIERACPKIQGFVFIHGLRLIDPKKGRLINLNASAKYILSLCDGKHSVKSIKNLVAKKYGLAVEQVDKDVEKFLLSAYEEGIVSFGEEEKSGEDKEVKKGRAIYWEITKRCNLKCKHCYASSSLLGRELDLKEIERILKESKELGVDSVTLTGGEPLIREDVWEIMELCLVHKMKLSIITNATLIDTLTARKLAKLPIHLQVSMDGTKKEVYEFVRGEGIFDVFMKGLNNLLEEGLAPRTTLALTIMKPNAFYLRDFFAFAERVGIKNLHFSWLQYQGNAKYNWECLALTVKEQVKVALYLFKLTRSNKHFEVSGDLCKNYLSSFTNPYLPQEGSLPCPLGHNPYIDAYGNVYGCQLFSDLNYKLGNSREEPLGEILDSSNIYRRYHSLVLRPWHIPECKHCRYLPFCRGGCPAEA
ncbi:MAG: PqqD family peptide modification chaperone, partial [bacterium]